MPPLIREHFYYLATYAIAAFLLSLGIISVLFSRLSHLPSAAMICCVLAILWSARFVLELAYPVEVSLFSVSKPNLLLQPVIGFMATIYVVATVLNAKLLVPVSDGR